VFRPKPGAAARVGVAIGESILDLNAIAEAGLLEGIADARALFAADSLNDFMSRGRGVLRRVRQIAGDLLDERDERIRKSEALRDRAILPRADVEMLLPARIGDYTDFYSSKEHATNVGTMFRGADNALMPNWVHLPVAYHGRASSIVASGTPIRRPRGQTKPDDADAPVFGPSRFVDYELEMGFFIGAGNALGRPIPIAEAEDRIFGLAIVNDWSARDIQRWEYVPLGPFLAKNFATTISPWVVTLEALEPFRVAGPEQSPTPLPHLQSPGPGAFDIKLEVAIRTEKMSEPFVIGRSNFRGLYWSMAQQLAHHASGGCTLRPGDLLASGTIGGADEASRGCLLERAWRGERPIELPSGEKRWRVEDGDEIVMTAWCEGDGYSVGFGEARGRLLPAETT
jgi:fumarylacetoacetase